MVSSQPQGVTFTPVTPKLCRFFSPFSGRFPSFVLSVLVFSVVSSLSLFGAWWGFWNFLCWISLAGCCLFCYFLESAISFLHVTPQQIAKHTYFHISVDTCLDHHPLWFECAISFGKKITILGDALLICSHDHTHICSWNLVATLPKIINLSAASQFIPSVKFLTKLYPVQMGLLFS